MRRVPFVFLRLILLATCLAAVGAAITHETMWMMKRVGSPAPSPDGKWVVFSLTEPSYDPDKQVSDLWIVPADGNSPPRRLTATKGGESGVAWSPDSARIAFSAKREGDEKSQIYILNVAGGGEAIRVTELTTGATAPEWSPDGERLLFQSRVYPGAASEQDMKRIDKERKDRKHQAHVYDGFPIRYWDEWLDDTRQHLFVQQAAPGAEARDLLKDSTLARTPGFSALLNTSGGTFQAVWAPDGESVVFTATVNRHEAARADVISHLYALPAGGGEPKDLTPGPHSFGSPRFSPDGKWLYATREPTNEWVYNLNRLARLSWPEPGALEILTAEWDRSVGAYALAPDSRTVFIEAQDEGRTRIFRMAAAGGAVTPVVEAEEGVFSGLAVPGKAAEVIVLANWQSHRSPAEVVRIDPAAKNHRNLTQFNREAAAGLGAQPARHFWFTSKRGRRIHNLVVLPPDFDESRKYPLVAFIHGGPHSASEDVFHFRWNCLLMASPGYVLLMTNYTGSTGFGADFAQAIQGDPLKTPGDEINEAVDAAIERFPFVDATRVAAGGASYGGHLSNWLQATTDRYRCLYSHAGLISLEGQWATSDVIYHRERNNGGPYWEGSPVWREQSPFRYAANYQTPVLLTVGEEDYRVPLNQTLAYWSVLQRREVPSRLVVFPRANHWIQNAEDSRYFYQELLGWLEKHLGR